MYRKGLRAPTDIALRTPITGHRPRSGATTFTDRAFRMLTATHVATSTFRSALRLQRRLPMLPRTTTLPPPQAHGVLDVSAFPHILESIISFSSAGTLWVLRGTCRFLRDWVDESFGQLCWRVSLTPAIESYLSDDGPRKMDVLRDNGSPGGQERLSLRMSPNGLRDSDLDSIERFFPVNRHAIVEVHFCRELWNGFSPLHGASSRTLDEYSLSVSQLLGTMCVDTLVIHPSANYVFDHNSFAGTSAHTIVVFPSQEFHLFSSPVKKRRVVYRILSGASAFGRLWYDTDGATDVVVHFGEWQSAMAAQMVGNRVSSNRNQLSWEIAKLLIGGKIRVTLTDVDQVTPEWLPLIRGRMFRRQPFKPSENIVETIREYLKAWTGIRQAANSRVLASSRAEEALSRLRFLTFAEYSAEVGHVQAAAEMREGIAGPKWLREVTYRREGVLSTRPACGC